MPRTFVIFGMEVIGIQELASQFGGKQLPNRAAPTQQIWKSGHVKWRSAHSYSWSPDWCLDQRVRETSIGRSTIRSEAGIGTLTFSQHQRHPWWRVQGCPSGPAAASDAFVPSMHQRRAGSRKFHGLASNHPDSRLRLVLVAILSISIRSCATQIATRTLWRPTTRSVVCKIFGYTDRGSARNDDFSHSYRYDRGPPTSHHLYLCQLSGLSSSDGSSIMERMISGAAE